MMKALNKVLACVETVSKETYYDWCIKDYIDKVEVLSSQSYIQEALSVFMKALDMTADEAVKYVTDYESEHWELLAYPGGSLQISWTGVDKDRDNRDAIVPYFKPEPALREEVILGARNAYKGRVSLDVLELLNNVGCKLNKEVMDKCKPKNLVGEEEYVWDYVGHNEFYFKWQFDKRGRTYSEGHTVDFQGETFRREVIDLAMAEDITPQGRIELYRQLGECVATGLTTFDEREALGRAAFAAGRDEDSTDPRYIKVFTALGNGATNILVGVDASASNIQIMGCLTGCEQTMHMTNCIGDLNLRVHNFVLGLMNQKLETEDKLSVDDIKDIVKPCIMTHYFNSISEPRSLLNEEQLDAFYESLNGLLPGAERFMNKVNSSWTDEEEFLMTAPDGHKVCLRRFVNQSTTYDIHGHEFEYEFRVPGADGNFRHLVANLTHTIDSWIAREIVRRANFDVLPIHDDFRCHPNNVETVKRLYRELMAEAVGMDLLGVMLTQITGKDTTVIKPENRELLQSHILNSKHMLN